MKATILTRAVQAESKAIVRPPAKNLAVNEDDLQRTAEVDSKRELLIAVFAVILTFASAIPIIMLRPTVAQWMRWEDPALQHPREFTATKEGGVIRYSAPALQAPNAPSPLAEYEADLSLLQRRFQRGQFRMVGIQGGESAPEYEAMRRQAGSFEYKVERNAGGASLTIKGRTPEARAALATYLKFLQDRWAIGR